MPWSACSDRTRQSLRLVGKPGVDFWRVEKVEVNNGNEASRIMVCRVAQGG